MRTKLDELTPEERAELEAYMKKANKRADKKMQDKLSSRKVYSVVMIVASAIFTIVFILSLALKWNSVALTIIAICLSVACLVAGLVARNLSDSEYSKATTPEANLVVLHYDNEVLSCPHCGSTNVLYHTKKFSVPKAVAGGVAFGYLGIAFGTPNNKRIKCRCQGCGHTFEMMRK